ncbi:MAG: hypothetical protein L3J67_14135, partial [Hyphomicrobiaceae bacterium]|nr:hypothetical protein [Hyphomicrobiaceae bacterium]
LGVSLIPVGIINDTHEPPTFYGVERNDVEKRIIPTTWWEGGAKAGGKLGETGLFWDAMAHSGLNNSVADGLTPGDIRGGRQKVSLATSDNPAYTGRVGWAYNGIKLSGTYQHQTDITPNDITKTEARLLEAHADIVQPLNDQVSLGLRALYARWDVAGTVAQASGRDELLGWYVEPSVKFELPNWGAIGLFYRYETWDETAGDAIASVNSRQTYGVNYWPTENVVLKADWRIDNNDTGARAEDNRFDLGMGFQF